MALGGPGAGKLGLPLPAALVAANRPPTGSGAPGGQQHVSSALSVGDTKALMGSGAGVHRGSASSTAQGFSEATEIPVCRGTPGARRDGWARPRELHLGLSLYRGKNPPALSWSPPPPARWKPKESPRCSKLCGAAGVPGPAGICLESGDFPARRCRGRRQLHVLQPGSPGLLLLRAGLLGDSAG